jgi:hypothetical protein
MKFIITIVILMLNWTFSLATVKVYDVAIRKNNNIFVSFEGGKNTDVFLVDINGVVKRRIVINGKRHHNNKNRTRIIHTNNLLPSYCVKCGFVKVFPLLNISSFKLGIGSNFHYGYTEKYCIGNICYVFIKFFL